MKSFAANAAGRFNLLCFLLAFFAATFWITDAAVNRQPALETAPSAPSAPRPAARMFVIIIDSLRYETATNPDFMPHLGALAAEGVSAKIDSGFTPATAASVRDIFTGRVNSGVLAWVINFAKVGGAVESLFSQMAREGMTSAVYSRWFIFDQFGSAITWPRPIPTDSTRVQEEPHMAEALALFLRGDANVVVAHIDTTDKVGHQFGAINTSDYREVFRRADAFIGEAHRSLPAGATLVVLGDHGHDEQARHTVGMNVPTFTVYRGPAFRRGVVLPTQKIQTHRWLMSQALGLRVDFGHYDGAVLPEVLRSSETLLGATRESLARRPTSKGGAPLLVWGYLAALGSLAVNLAARGRSPLNLSGWRSVLPWLALVPIVLVPAWQAELGLALAAGCALVWAWGVPLRRATAWIVAPLAAGLLFHGWGRALFALRPLVEALTTGQAMMGWAAVALVGAAWVNERQRPWLTGAVFAGALLLGFPSNERFGFPSFLVPLAGCWLVFYVATLIRSGRLRGTDGRWDRRQAAHLAVCSGGMFFCLQPFASLETMAGDFRRWVPVIPGLEASSLWHMAALAFAVKLLVFVPRWPGWTRACAIAVFAAGLVALEWGGWRFATRTWLLLLAGFIGAWLLAAWWRRPEARVLGLGTLFLGYRYFTWPEVPQLMHATTAMIGALVLGARLVRRHPLRGSANFDPWALGVLGLLVAGWGTCLWSVRYLDWEFAIAWVGISALEVHAWLFGPLIAFKNALPWLALVWCLRDEIAPRGGLPLNAWWLSVVAKFSATLMLNTGLAVADYGGANYYLAAQTTTAIGLLLFSLIPLRGVWPAPGASVPHPSPKASSAPQLVPAEARA